VDDSISTVPQSTIAALNAYSSHPTVLFLGGTDRGQDYSDLFDLLPATAVKCVVLLPPNGERIEKDLRRRSISIPIIPASCFEEGVKQALRRASPGELLLLSPAAPSFGEFRNFEERGNAFKLLCAKHISLLNSLHRNHT
jgi:UDP-N-acetylmuramoylalanine--D-glutamate ligase